MEKLKSFFSQLSKIHKILIIVGIIFVLLITTVFTLYNVNTSAVASKSSPIVFEVAAGDTIDSVSERLEEKKIIKSATFAKLSAKLNGLSSLVAGQFRVDKSWSTSKILNHLTKQKNVMRNQVMLTFKEGIWAKDIAVLIGEHTNVTSEQLIALWNDDAFLKQAIEKYDFLDDSILNSEYRIKLEGYLFPETYEFNKKTSAEEITYVFLNQFQKEYNVFKKDLDKLGWSLHDVITFASVVQHEASKVNDMKLISGVFHNRLDINMRLESSVTICYALYDYENWQECEMNTGIESPYNTYQNSGLPIGPILNPGLDAIKATINPTKSDYLYFLADMNGDRTVYYATTYEEHLKNQKKYLGY